MILFIKPPTFSLNRDRHFVVDFLARAKPNNQTDPSDYHPFTPDISNLKRNLRPIYTTLPSLTFTPSHTEQLILREDYLTTAQVGNMLSSNCLS
jgi:hypothetical protein